MFKFNHSMSRMLSCLFSFLAVYTVNSVCILGLGQDSEPDKLAKYKKNNY